MDFNEMLLRTAIDPGRTLGEFAKTAFFNTPGTGQAARLGLAGYRKGKGLLDQKEAELAAMVDPGANPEVATPMGVVPQPFVPNAEAGEFASDPGAGLQMGMAQGRDAQMAAEAAAKKEIAERNFYASQGMQYYAPGIGFKGKMLGKGEKGSAFGQSYTSAGPGGGGSPVAEGGEYEQELATDSLNRQLERETSVAARQQVLAERNLSPVDRARIEAMSKTRYNVDPVEQQAFALGKRIAGARQAALQKAMSDTGGDPEAFAQAQARIDALYPMDYQQLLANALGERAIQDGLTFTGE
jgi:hypothetical protein